MFNCECCGKLSSGGYESPDKHLFCSIECACYAGRFSVTKGWINSRHPVLKSERKSAIQLDSAEG